MPPIRRDKGYATYPHYPSFKTERRIKIPQIIKRPYRFPVHTLIRAKEISKDPFWFILHRRGPTRKWIGENPLEMRAISHDLIRGTLPERIIYKYLVQNMHFDPTIDFNFQSSLQGGRIDTGGIVADFQFPYLMIILNPLGPTHNEYIRIQKDNEQNMSLAEMGYQVYMIPEEDVYDEMKFESLMRRIFNWTHSGGGDTIPDQDMDPATDGFRLDYIYSSIKKLQEII